MSGSRESGSDWLGADRHASASSLAAFAEGALPPDEMRAIAAHVAGCDECAERVAAYAEVDSLVRAAPAPIPPASLRAGLYARIGAETWQASGRQLAADREATAREIETKAFPVADTTSSIPSSPANPSRLSLPPIPSIARWGGAVAAALIVALLASVLITLGQSRNGANTLTRPTATIQPQPTATVLPQPACAPNQLQANLPARTLLNDLAMTSPGTGWAVGATADSVSNTPTYHSLILRLSDCKWSPFGASLPNATLASLAMVSLADGWAAGAQFRAHIDWGRPAALACLMPALILAAVAARLLWFNAEEGAVE
jgi:anti-sigma factor RsiW